MTATNQNTLRIERSPIILLSELENTINYGKFTTLALSQIVSISQPKYQYQTFGEDKKVHVYFTIRTELNFSYSVGFRQVSPELLDSSEEKLFEVHAQLHEILINKVEHDFICIGKGLLSQQAH